MPTGVLMESMLYPLVYLDVRKRIAYFRKKSVLFLYYL